MEDVSILHSRSKEPERLIKSRLPEARLKEYRPSKHPNLYQQSDPSTTAIKLLKKSSPHWDAQFWGAPAHCAPFAWQRASLMAQTVKRLPAMWKTRVWSLVGEDPLEKEIASHSSTLAWKIPWTEEPGRLWSMGSQRVGHDWAILLTLLGKAIKLFILFYSTQTVSEIQFGTSAQRPSIQYQPGACYQGLWGPQPQVKTNPSTC